MLFAVAKMFSQLGDRPQETHHKKPNPEIFSLLIDIPEALH